MAHKNDEDNSQLKRNYKNKYSNELQRQLLILPPGTEENTNIYGSLTIKIGKIIYLNTAFPFENVKIRLKFWG